MVPLTAIVRLSTIYRREKGRCAMIGFLVRLLLWLGFLAFIYYAFGENVYWVFYLVWLAWNWLRDGKRD
jgi:threonine/homoserine/homoserine lactone efflux protein